MSDTKPDVLQPIIIDLGKQEKKRLKRLKRGEGKLAAKVREAAEHARAQAGDDRDIIPVVLVFRKKDRRP